jgi:hypothetical protein
MPDFEIILANLSHLDCASCDDSYEAPLGLYCLAALANDRIAVADSRQQVFEEVASLITARCKSVILSLPEHYSPAKISNFCIELRKLFKHISIGINSAPDGFEKYADFAVLDNGKSSVYRILKGEKLAGICGADESEESVLPVPLLPLCDKGHTISPEKMLTVGTIEIYQPWLGLQDQTSKIKTYPKIDWLRSMVVWLKSSGFKGFHFRPSGITGKTLRELTELMQSEKAAFAISPETNDLKAVEWAKAPLKQIWFYKPNNIAELSERLKEVKSAGVLCGLHIDKSFCETAGTLLTGSVDRLVIEDCADWQHDELKRVIKRFWWQKGRFLKRLICIKNVSELIAFIKSSYRILDILLERKGS